MGGDVPCEHDAYQRAARSGYPATLGAELGWRCHRPHLPSSTPPSQEVSTVPGPPEKSQTQKREGHRRGRSQTKRGGKKCAISDIRLINLSLFRFRSNRDGMNVRVHWALDWGKKRNIWACIINDNTCVQCFFLKLSRTTPEFWRQDKPARSTLKTNCF